MRNRMKDPASGRTLMAGYNDQRPLGRRRVAGREEGRMNAAAEPGQHLTLLQFRRVVPSSAWLRASILWADDLAAIWPMREPKPLNRAQEQPLQEVWSLLNAGYFQRCEALDCS